MIFFGKPRWFADSFQHKKIYLLLVYKQTLLSLTSSTHSGFPLIQSICILSYRPLCILSLSLRWILLHRHVRISSVFFRYLILLFYLCKRHRYRRGGFTIFQGASTHYRDKLHEKEEDKSKWASVQNLTM